MPSWTGVKYCHYFTLDNPAKETRGCAYVVVNGFDWGAGGVISPESARSSRFSPGRQSTTVGPTGEDPGLVSWNGSAKSQLQQLIWSPAVRLNRPVTYSFRSVAAAMLVEGELNGLSKVSQVGNGVLQGQVLQILGRQGSVWRRSTIVAVYIQVR